MKSKKSSKKNAPVASAPGRSLDSIHVKDCLVWPDPSATSQQRQTPDTNTFYRTKPALGKPINRGYTMTSPAHVTTIDDGDHVIQALRGWPQQQQEQEDDLGGMLVIDSSQYDAYGNTKEQSKGKKKKGHKKGNENDAHIADLVSHRFMYEAALARQRKAEEEERAALEARKAMRSKRFPSDIKATKTTQLRSIAMATKVDSTCQDLWQMPKFKNNAVPALDTNNRKSRSGKAGNRGLSAGGARGGSAGSHGVHDTCTCGDENAGYNTNAGEAAIQHGDVGRADSRGEMPASPFEEARPMSGVLAL